MCPTPQGRPARPTAPPPISQAATLLLTLLLLCTCTVLPTSSQPTRPPEQQLEAVFSAASAGLPAADGAPQEQMRSRRLIVQLAPSFAARLIGAQQPPAASAEAADSPTAELRMVAGTEISAAAAKAELKQSGALGKGQLRSGGALPAKALPLLGLAPLPDDIKSGAVTESGKELAEEEVAQYAQSIGLERYAFIASADSLVLEARDQASVQQLAERIQAADNSSSAVVQVLADALLVPAQLPTGPNADPQTTRRQWSLLAIEAYNQNGNGAWSVTRGSDQVVVAVLDTGVDWQHPDLQANMWSNPAEVCGNGRDDDGNGFADDGCEGGWSWALDSSTMSDPVGHGTHIAGIIGAVSGNAVGISGVSPLVRLMALQIFGSSSGSSCSFTGVTGLFSEALAAIEFAVDNGAHVLSNSYLFSSPCLAASGARLPFDACLGLFQRQVDSAAASGVLFVSAAGNAGTNNDVVRGIPVSVSGSNVLAVANTNDEDGLYTNANSGTGSNYGPESVHLGAPGTAIFSTWPQQCDSFIVDGYQYLSGTSMAAPHVAGAAALVLAAMRSCGLDISLGGAGRTADTSSFLQQALMDTVDPLPALSGTTISGGRLNARKAVEYAVVNYCSLQGSVEGNPAVQATGDGGSSMADVADGSSGSAVLATSETTDGNGTSVAGSGSAVLATAESAADENGTSAIVSAGISFLESSILLSTSPAGVVYTLFEAGVTQREAADVCEALRQQLAAPSEPADARAFEQLVSSSSLGKASGSSSAGALWVQSQSSPRGQCALLITPAGELSSGSCFQSLPFVCRKNAAGISVDSPLAALLMGR